MQSLSAAMMWQSVWQVSGSGMLVTVSSISSSAALQSPTVSLEQPKGREVFTELVAGELSWRLLEELNLIMTATSRRL